MKLRLPEFKFTKGDNISPPSLTIRTQKGTWQLAYYPLVIKNNKSTGFWFLNVVAPTFSIMYSANSTNNYKGRDEQLDFLYKELERNPF